MKLPKKIKSSFAILDVEGKVRHQLAEHFVRHPRTDGVLPDAARAPIVISGFICGQWGGDDGTSIEFEVEVIRVDVQDAHSKRLAR